MHCISDVFQALFKLGYRSVMTSNSISWSWKSICILFLVGKALKTKPACCVEIDFNDSTQKNKPGSLYAIPSVQKVTWKFERGTNSLISSSLKNDFLFRKKERELFVLSCFKIEFNARRICFTRHIALEMKRAQNPGGIERSKIIHLLYNCNDSLSEISALLGRLSDIKDGISMQQLQASGNTISNLSKNVNKPSKYSNGNLISWNKEQRCFFWRMPLLAKSLLSIILDMTLNSHLGSTM